MDKDARGLGAKRGQKKLLRKERTMQVISSIRAQLDFVVHCLPIYIHDSYTGARVQLQLGA